MKLIGVKRALILAILFAINLAVAAVYFLQIGPMKEEAQARLNGVTAEISAQSQKIANIRADLAKFRETLPLYQELEKKGFALNQDRFRMSRDLDAVRNKAALTGFSFVINDIKKIQNAEADAAQLQVINSRIKIDNVVSLIDTPFYNFLDMMYSEFPTHVRMQSLEITRKDPLDAAALAKITRGEAVNLISAKAVFDWLTVVPKQDQPGGPGGGL